MPQPFHNEQAVVIDGETIRFVLDFRAIDATEQMLNLSYSEILDAVQKPNPPSAFLGKVLWGLLREHHPEMTWDEIGALLFGENGLTVGVTLQKLFEASFPVAEKAKGKNPPKPRGASKPS